MSLDDSFFAAPTDRGRTLDLVGKFIHDTFSTLRIYTYNPSDLQHACNFLINQHPR